MDQVKVRDVMTHLVVAFRPGDTIRDAAKMLVKNRISGGPVIEEGKLVGLVSEADLVRAYAPSERKDVAAAFNPLSFLVGGITPLKAGCLRVDEVMTERVVSVGPDANVLTAASRLDRRGFRRLPVVDDEGYVVGIVTRSDLVRAMAHRELRVAPPHAGLAEQAV